MLLLVAAAVWLLIADRSSPPTGTTPPAGSAEPVGDELQPPSAAEFAAIETMLSEHGAALLAHDRAGWQQGLDVGSTSYLQQQRQLFDNVARLPLVSWRYVARSAVTDSAALTAATKRLGARTVILHVNLDFALRLVDPAPTSKDLWLTVVERGTSWKLAGDSDAGAAERSWRGPWDFGPLLVEQGRNALVIGHQSESSQLGSIAALVDRSIPIVTSVWGGHWNQQVLVLVPDSAEEFNAEVGADEGADIAAVAAADVVTTGGDVLGARIVLNPATLMSLDAPARQLVVQHELTHIATRASTAAATPRWLVEGFADYVGHLDSSQSPAAAAPQLAAEVRAGHVPADLPADSDFETPDRLNQTYDEAWLACRFIARRIGQAALVRFYVTVSDAARQNQATAVTVGLHRVLRLSEPAFLAAWQASLPGTLSGSPTARPTSSASASSNAPSRPADHSDRRG
ncbi:MAG: hypothetical protein JWN95_1480 [Frankiales bacterium]|nr:hypothetical protein [Frankiales bacterium]